MNEGAKILELLRTNGKSVADLARACGVSHPGAERYIRAETLGPKAWDTASRGLVKLGIDPSLIRPVAATFHRERPATDLRPLLRGFSKAQLSALVQILDARDEDRRVLRAIVEDRLERNAP